VTVEVVSIGRVNIDISMSVKKLPKLPSHIVSEDGHISMGGSAANYAMQSARLGVKTGLVSCIGDDSYGQMAMKDISKEGVDTKGVLVLEKQSTGLFFMAKEKTGSRMVFATPGANKFLDKHTLDESYLNRAAVIHIAGGFPMMIGTTADLATTEGIILSLDPGRDASSIDFNTVLQKTDLLFLNTGELKQYFGIAPTKKELKNFAKTFPGIVIVKRGKKGAIATDGFEYCNSQAFEVPVVDTLGSGDAFAAGFVTAWTRCERIEQALHFGNAVGALTITQKGAQNGQPTLDETEALMKKNGISIKEITRTFRRPKKQRGRRKR
jgi:ribokinase